MEETKNYELCIACGCTSNRQWQQFYWDCWFEIEED